MWKIAKGKNDVGHKRNVVINYRSHTVRLGLSTLLKGHPELAGCMFALGDRSCTFFPDFSPRGYFKIKFYCFRKPDPFRKSVF